MNYNEIKKIVIAPQIVVYKNIFKNSQNIIDLVENDHPDSLFTDWRDWYEQGTRKDVLFNKFNNIKEEDSERVKIEKQYLKEVCDIADFINKDYFGEFKGDRGIWPEFIKDWEVIKDTEDSYYIDYFKYSLAKNLENTSNLNRNLMMHYHVDEFPIPGQFKKRRHVITINYYLNDEYTGGEICAYDSISNKSYQYKPKPGDVVVMPSTAPFYHGVKNFDKNDRYFLRTFIDYPVNETSEDQYNWDELKIKEEEFIKNNMQHTKVSVVEDVVDLDV
jgi:hypothetical protein